MRAALPKPPRDPRLDLVRGWLQLSIFASHATGSLIGAWGIHAAWGPSDSSEQFILLSGLLLGSVFARSAERDGFAQAAREMRPRILRLWRVHLVLLLGFGALVVAADRLWFPGEAARLGWHLAPEAPGLAALLGATLLWRPGLLDIFAVFLLGMALLPGFVWLCARLGGAALVLPFGLWAAVQAGLVSTPNLFHQGWGFEPLAWQALFLLGVFLGWRSWTTAGRPLPLAAWLTGASLLLVALGLWWKLGERGWAPGPGLPAGKEALEPLRLLHALALAWLVARFVPRAAPWMERGPARLLAAAGRRSLEVYGLGLFLSWGASAAFRVAPPLWWLEIPLVGGGALLLMLFARRLEQRPAAPRRPAFTAA